MDRLARVDMALSDNAVYDAINGLMREQGEFTYQQVADRVGCSKRTVDRAIARLRAANRITIITTPGKVPSWADLRHDPNR